MAAWNGNGSQNSVAHLDPLKGTVLRDNMGGGKGGERRKDLSRDDLVFLLSIMEGELQVRTGQNSCVLVFLDLGIQ